MIDLEGGGETEETDLQRALRRRRPDYIAAAEERAGRVSRGAAERAKEDAMTRSTEGGSKASQVSYLHLLLINPARPPSSSMVLHHLPRSP